MSIEIKELARENSFELAPIFLACLKQDYQDVLPATVLNDFSLEESEKLWAESLSSPTPHRFIGAYFEGELVGFSKIGVDPEDPSAGYLASLYVHPNSSGKGIGRKLLSFSLANLNTYPVTRLWVFANNERATGLYESLGFRLNGRSRTQSPWQTLEVELELINTK